MSGVAVATIDDVGTFSDLTEISVDDGTAASHTISAGKQGILFMNTGDELCWMGGSTVDADAGRGIILLPRVMMLIRKCKSDFQVWFQCTTGLTTTIGVVEYD